MAETQKTEFETRLAALEKTIRELSAMLEIRTRSLAQIQSDATTARDNTARVVTMLEEVLPLIRQAAPLLDSPLVKMAHSPAAGVLSVFGGGRRGR